MAPTESTEEFVDLRLGNPAVLVAIDSYERLARVLELHLHLELDINQRLSNLFVDGSPFFGVGLPVQVARVEVFSIWQDRQSTGRQVWPQEVHKVAKSDLVALLHIEIVEELVRQRIWQIKGAEQVPYFALHYTPISVEVHVFEDFPRIGELLRRLQAERFQSRLEHAWVTKAQLLSDVHLRLLLLAFSPEGACVLRLYGTPCRVGAICELIVSTKRVCLGIPSAQNFWALACFAQARRVQGHKRRRLKSSVDTRGWRPSQAAVPGQRLVRRHRCVQ
mmetsp:Transcript_52760/g.112923  ORF Transcript_52760/g.112923 Transcript_52760/m.112923 type:complete len:277 (-) Transcript_52760:61-891(-)